jgi:hypothetical protein
VTEDRVVEAVRAWFVAQGWSAPTRVVVRRRSDDGWWVVAGPEAKENGLKIDPRTLKIIEFHAGQ